MHRASCLAILLIQAVFLLLPASVCARAPVLLVMSASDGVYRASADAIRQHLPAGTAVDEVHWQKLDDLHLQDRQVVVSLGRPAARALTRRAPRPPVLHTLITRASFSRLPDARIPDPEQDDDGSESSDAAAGPLPVRSNAAVSAIFIDHPPARQIALIRLALPTRNRLALLAGPASATLVGELEAEARKQGLHTVRAEVRSDHDLYQALQQLFRPPSVLLATPDPAVFNAYTVQNILLTAYRHHSPVIGFSAAYARAGALVTLYSTPDQLGRQAAAAVGAVLAGGRLPPPAAPQDFEIGINDNVARSLGTRLEPAAALVEKLRALEGGP